ncbi:DEAD/DEAH box helicase [Methanosphaera sp. Vir-13MRS]|uniref:DEAD/DEAH box helicase n=1 Tax=Candidatus Methanosphaera massiliense TaxID=3017187 RepID=UPI0023806ED1|nr:DEAD/DEAH box helicase [Candidatus Methanosphaera massiliense]MDD6285109.1 DEAD/DEAH box helicase [Methanobacteriaceae archaeon]MDE4078322.1 DEAD/DEAH box helicase [Candidatus Methanosphaera massiliense]
MIKDILTYFQNKKWFRDRIEHIEEIPARRARYTLEQVELPEPLENYLNDHNIKLYTHQYEALKHVRNGENVVITTPTASGKTLSFTLPVIEDLTNNREDTALYIYPTKALANDQLKSILSIDNECNLDIYPAKYDGDTPKSKRPEIKRKSRLVITNPYELHYILPWHEQWQRFFENIKYIIIDEAHQYRGVFGSNMAFLIRRLKRICKYYGSEPQFIISTATLANPMEFSEKLTGLSYKIIDDNGSPSGKKYFMFFNPYAIESKNPSIHNDTLKLFNTYVQNDLQTICFEISRKMAEVIALRSKKELEVKQPELSNKITAYRAGYTVEERKKIEDNLKEGKIKGIVTTNALELGINIGSLDSVIISGYPGTLISTWQQAGRAGRRNQEALITMVAFQNPLDQYFMKHPERFFNKTHEHAIIDLNNQQILREHLKCAAYEIPLKLNEIESFGFDDEGIVIDEISDLETEGILKYSNNQWIYNDERILKQDKTPNLELNLNDVRSEPYAVFNGRTFLEEMSEKQAFREAHENAVLIHNGDTYLVKELDIHKKRVYVKKKDLNYYTQALKEVDVKIIKEEQQNTINNIKLSYGRLNVTEKYDRYNVIKFSKITSSKKLNLPPLNFKTKGLWFTIPFEIREKVKETLNTDTKFEDAFMGCLQGVANVMLSVTPYHVMCDTYDLGGVTKNMHEDTLNATIFIYDGFEDGVGLTKKAYKLFKDIIKMSYELVRDCECESGCPACIYSSQQQTDDKHLNKEGTLLILKELYNNISKNE